MSMISNRGYLPTYDDCYVCGQAHPRGLRLRFFLGEEGCVHADFTPDDLQTGYKGVVHGGVISAALDEIMGWPISLQAERLCFTGELTVRFLKPAAPHVTYRITARPGTDQGRYWTGAGEICDEHGTVYARGSGKYFLLKDEQAAAMALELTYAPNTLPVFRALHPVRSDD